MVNFRPLPFMTAFALATLGFLLLAGRWQWERYETKKAQIGAPMAEQTLEDYEPIPDGIQLVYSIARGGEAGWRVFAPVRTGEEVVFVDAAFLPSPPAEVTKPNWEDVPFPASLRYNAPIVGAPIRPSPPAAFSEPSHPLERLWAHVELQAMGRAAGLENVANYYLAIPYVAEDGRARPNPFARANGADPLPPERHLGYSITWYGLAAVLIGLYFAYHINVGRLRFSPRPDDGPKEQ